MGLRDDLARFAKGVNARVEDLHEEVVIQVANVIVTGSAVDTGRFRANWVPGINAVNTGTTEATDKQGDDTQEKIFAAIPKPGGVFYITNSLPYARRLEYEGWSKQMPAGVVRITAVRFEEFLQKALAKVGRA